MAIINPHTTRATGTVLTAAIYNADHQNHITNANALNADIAATLIPPTTKMLFVQSAAPVGWTKDTTHNDKALRVVSGSAGSGGTVAFSTAFGNYGGLLTGGTALSIANLAAHAHTQQGSFNSGTVSSDHTHFVSLNSGTVSALHTHNFTWPNTFVGGGGVQGSGGSFGANAVGSTTTESANHFHGVSGSTGGISANHFHATTISGATANAGSGTTHTHALNFNITVNYVDVIIGTRN